MPTNTRIILKSNTTSGAVPSNTDLVYGELAINVADRKLFSIDTSNTVFEISGGGGGGGGGPGFGTLYFTDGINANIAADFAGDILLVTGNNGIHFLSNNSNDELTIGINAAANVVVNNLTTTTSLTVGNSTVNTFVNSSVVSVGSDTVLNTSALVIGNSTVNASVNSSVLTVGSNVALNTSALFIGNSTVNTVINSVSGSYLKGNYGNVGSTSAINNIFRVNANVINSNITFIAGENVSAVGPLEIANGVTIDIQTGATVAIV